ncbi:MAG: glycosyltransferase [Candidatus Omnitrophica bacterium]|nr:glycosyltransferase [Candidatus Omnitrophota bacterium]
MQGAKRILLTYITLNSGHHMASCAIENALKQISPNTQTLNINALGYTNPILEKIINKTYMTVIRNKPEVWEYLYDNPKVLKGVQGMREAIHRFNSKKLKKLLEDFKPDAVVCTQAFPCGMVADYKRNSNLKLPLVGVLTDHAPHAYWIFPDVDYYVMPSEISRAKFIKNGINPLRIKTFGVPIDLRFSKKHDKRELCDKLGFDTQKPIVLIMGGSQGLGPVESIVNALEGIEIDFQLAAICGINTKLKNMLSKRARKYRKKFVVFGHVDNVDELMEISSMVITKPGGLTTTEALAKDLPMIIVRPIPGQELKNTEFLLSQGVALRAQDREDIAALVKELLLKSNNKLMEMRTRAAELKKPNAAMDIAELLLNM